MNELIEGSEFIVVAEIVKAPSYDELDMHAGGHFDIQLIRVLKGEAKAGTRATALLHDVPFMIDPYHATSLTQGLTPGRQYLLFLNKPGVHWHQDNGKPPAVDFENAMGAGDAVLIGWPVATGYFNLDLLDGKTLQQSIAALLNHAATQQRKFAEAVNVLMERRSRLFTQTIVPIMCFDHEAEEAASYYVSIFRNSPYPTGQSRIEHVFRNRPESSGKNPVMGVIFFLEDQRFIAVNGDSKNRGVGTNSFTLGHHSSNEIDYFEQKLSEGGQRAGGGWIKDKFGVSWNLGPGGINETMDSIGEAERSDAR